MPCQPRKYARHQAVAEPGFAGRKPPPARSARERLARAGLHGGGDAGGRGDVPRSHARPDGASRRGRGDQCRAPVPGCAPRLDLVWPGGQRRRRARRGQAAPWSRPCGRGAPARRGGADPWRCPGEPAPCPRGGRRLSRRGGGRRRRRRRALRNGLHGRAEARCGRRDRDDQRLGGSCRLRRRPVRHRRVNGRGVGRCRSCVRDRHVPRREARSGRRAGALRGRRDRGRGHRARTREHGERPCRDERARARASPPAFGQQVHRRLGSRRGRLRGVHGGRVPILRSGAARGCGHRLRLRPGVGGALGATSGCSRS